MATSPVLFVYYPPLNDDSWPGVPGRHITEADWASFTIAQRRTVENATTQEGYTRRKVWVHRDLVDETEQERAAREAAEAAARAEYDRKNSLVRYGQIETMIDQLEVLPPAEEFAALRQDVDAVADVPPRVEAVETAVARVDPGAVGDDGTAIVYEGGAPRVRRLGFWDVTWSGAAAYSEGTSPASMTDSAAAIRAAVAKAKSLGVPVTGRGTYRVDSTVTIDIDHDFTGATFVTTTTTLPRLVLIGVVGATAIKHLRGVAPMVVQAAHVKGGGWGSDVGIEVRNVSHSSLAIPYAEGFGRGLWFTADGSQGTVHNITVLGDFVNCKEMLVCGADSATAWVNSNTFQKGGFAYTTSEGTNIPGTREILIARYPGGLTIDHNVFESPALETKGAEYLVEIQGSFNHIREPRLESNVGGNRVLFNGGQYNSITLGASDAPLAAVEINGAARNRVQDIYGDWLQFGGLTPGGGGLTLSNTTSGGDILTVMDLNATVETDRASAYIVKMTRSATRFKRDTEAFPRIEIDHRNSRINLGAGISASDIGLLRGGADRLTLDAGDAFRVGAVASLPTASASWRGYTLRVEGGAGVADETYQCRKTESDTYEWVKLTP